MKTNKQENSKQASKVCVKSEAVGAQGPHLVVDRKLVPTAAAEHGNVGAVAVVPVLQHITFSSGNAGGGKDAAVLGVGKAQGTRTKHRRW